jgi:tetratricopeptide (TPR) repeat protein
MMLQQAVEQYRQVLSEEPGNKYAANNLGVALAELGQIKEAETALREALRVDTQDFILFNLALVLYRKYQETPEPSLREEVLALLQQYVQLAPSDQVAVQYLEKLKSDHQLH